MSSAQWVGSVGMVWGEMARSQSRVASAPMGHAAAMRAACSGLNWGRAGGGF